MTFSGLLRSTLHYIRTICRPPVPRVVLMALFGLPVLYVVLFGPACWAVDRGILPAVETARVFRPLVRVGASRILGVAGVIRWYVGIGLENRDDTWFLHRLDDALDLDDHYRL